MKISELDLLNCSVDTKVLFLILAMTMALECYLFVLDILQWMESVPLR